MVKYDTHAHKRKREIKQEMLFHGLLPPGFIESFLQPLTQHSSKNIYITMINKTVIVIQKKIKH